MKTNREEILQSALQLFMSMNYEGVSLQMIAHSVGLTKTGIFNYYPTKLDLVHRRGRPLPLPSPGPREQVRAHRTGRCGISSTNTSKACSARWPKSCVWATSGEKRCPERSANAGYFHLYQQVLFYYPDGKRKLNACMEKEYLALV